MNFWDRVTGNDMNKQFVALEARARELPEAYQTAWEQIKAGLWGFSDLTGRNLMPILDGMLGLLEETSSEGLSVAEAIGDDIPGFCAAVAGGEGATTYRDRWRRQLNKSIAAKLSKE